MCPGGSHGVSPDPLHASRVTGWCWDQGPQALQAPRPRDEGSQALSGRRQQGGQGPGGRHGDSQRLLSDSWVFLTTRPDLWERSHPRQRGFFRSGVGPVLFPHL